MIRVAVAGASGKLGSIVSRLVQSHPEMEMSLAIVSPESPNLDRELLPGVRAKSPDDLVSALN